MLFSDAQSGAEFLTKPSLKTHRSERPAYQRKAAPLGHQPERVSKLRVISAIPIPISWLGVSSDDGNIAHGIRLLIGQVTPTVIDREPVAPGRQINLDLSTPGPPQVRYRD